MSDPVTEQVEPGTPLREWVFFNACGQEVGRIEGDEFESVDWPEGAARAEHQTGLIQHQPCPFCRDGGRPETLRGDSVRVCCADCQATAPASVWNGPRHWRRL